MSAVTFWVGKLLTLSKDKRLKKTDGFISDWFTNYLKFPVPLCIICVQYIGGYHAYIGDTMSTSGDILSTWWDVQYIGGIMIHVGEQVNKSIWFILTTPMYWTSPDVLMIFSTCIMIFWCTEHHPMYSWYPTMYSWYPPDVLMIRCRCTHGIPLYTEHPPDKLNTPDVLNIPRCIEHTLYRVSTIWAFIWLNKLTRIKEIMNGLPYWWAIIKRHIWNKKILRWEVSLRY